MIYAVGISAILAVVFGFLFVRSAVANGVLRRDNAELKGNVDLKQKQLEIAANHPDTPADLAKRMREGTL